MRGLNAMAILMLAMSFTMSTNASAEVDNLLTKAHRIVFLGDSITYDGRYVADFETWLATHHRDRMWEVINVGLPSETVSGLTEEGHANGAFPRPVLGERLDRVLAQTKPDLIIACYGMNCGIYKPFDAERFAKYQAGITQLHDAAVKAGAQIVHMTPPTYDHLTGKNAALDYNDVLGKYGEWILSKQKDGWIVVDLHGPMMAEIAKRRTAEPDFTFQPDGVHPDDAGHWFMAHQLIHFFGDAKSAMAENPEVMTGHGDVGKEILQVVHDRMAVTRDAWLTQTGHTHPSIPKGKPMKEAEAAAAEFSKHLNELVGTAGVKP